MPAIYICCFASVMRKQVKTRTEVIHQFGRGKRMDHLECRTSCRGVTNVNVMEWKPMSFLLPICYRETRPGMSELTEA